VKAEVLKGHLDGLLLAALETGPRHGYAIIEALREGSGGRIDLPTGTVYPALHRLERAGLIRGDWSHAAGRPRRTYQLTPPAAPRWVPDALPGTSSSPPSAHSWNPRMARLSDSDPEPVNTIPAGSPPISAAT
jgi:PadR family transcriptional regulator